MENKEFFLTVIWCRKDTEMAHAALSVYIYYLLAFARQRKKGQKVRAQRPTDKLWLQVKVSVQVSDLTERQELLIVALGYINH